MKVWSYKMVIELPQKEYFQQLNVVQKRKGTFSDGGGV